MINSVEKILNYGLSPEQSPEERKRRTVLNVLLLSGIAPTPVICTLLLWNAESYLPFAWGLIHSIVLSSCFIFQKKINESLTTFIAICWTSIFLYGLLFLVKGKIRLEFVFALLCYAPLVTINPDFKITKRLCLTITMVSCVATYFFNSQTIGLFEVPQFVLDSLNHITFLVFFGLSTALIASYSAETKRLSEEALLAQKKVAHSSRLAELGTISAGIGHEINNPLVIARGFIELLDLEAKKGEKVNPKVLEKIAKQITGSIDRISNIVIAMRHLVRNTDRDDAEFVSLLQAVEDATTLATSKLRTIGLVVDTNNLCPDVEVYFKHAELAQLFFNFLTNAADALEGTNTVNPKIEIYSEHSPEGNLHIFIHDNGPGIPEDIRESVLTPFFTTKETGKGTGLGLSLCVSICESFSCQLSIEPSEKGALFKITVPDKHFQNHKQKLAS